MSPDTPRQHFLNADDARALQALVFMGSIAEVDHSATPPRARVQLGSILTAPLPVPQEVGANFRRWRPVRVGSQVLLACPGGDTRQAVIVQIYNTEALPPPSTDDAVDLIEFDDGTILRKDGTALLIDSAVPATLKAPQITLDGEVFVQGGSLHKVGGSMDHDGQDVGKTHIHLIIAPVPGTPVTPPMPLGGA